MTTQSNIEITLAACKARSSTPDVDAPFQAMLISDQLSGAEKQHLLLVALDYWSNHILDTGIFRGAYEVVRELIVSGANPLIKYQSVSGETLFSTPLMSVVRPHPDIALHVINMLYVLKRDTGEDRLSEDGNTILHMLCSMRSDWLGNALDSALNGSRMRMPPLQTMSLPSHMYFHNEWISAKNENGETPLHRVWKTSKGLFVSIGCAPDSDPWAWDASEYLRQLGGSLVEPDKTGTSPATLIVELVDRGMEVPSGIEDFSAIVAAHEASVLQASSPAVNQISQRRSL